MNSSDFKSLRPRNLGILLLEKDIFSNSDWECIIHSLVYDYDMRRVHTYKTNQQEGQSHDIYYCVEMNNNWSEDEVIYVLLHNKATPLKISTNLCIFSSLDVCEEVNTKLIKRIFNLDVMMEGAEPQPDKKTSGYFIDIFC